MGREFFLPGRTIMGENALETLPDNISGFGKKALIVTGKTVCTLDGFKKQKLKSIIARLKRI